jgi:D-beta-D-heptose 7-phosphate kinase/D-beta-D-heptose 1-phosphate adenosyltransferase
LRVDNEEFIGCKGRFLPCEEIKSWIDEIQPDSIILSDYLKGAITQDLARTVIDSKNKKKIFVDTRRPNIQMFKGANWITPNKHEFQKILDNIYVQQPAWKPTPKMVCGYAELEGILLTRGSEGMDLHIKDMHFHEDSTNNHIVDVTGAGDLALATFTLIQLLYPKMLLKQMLRITNLSAGLGCMQMGTAVSDKTLKELIQLVEKERRYQ